MRTIPRNVRSDARWKGARVEYEDGSTINSRFAYHAAFLAVGQLLTQPLRLLRGNQPKPNLASECRRQRKVAMTKIHAPRWGRALRDGIAAIVTPIAVWYQRQRMIEELTGLSDNMLADIGLTREGIPTLVRQAYRPIPEETFVATAPVAALRTTGKVGPAASNDTTRHSLAA